MGLPGFGAEASLYQTRGRYYAVAGFDDGSGAGDGASTMPWGAATPAATSVLTLPGTALEYMTAKWAYAVRFRDPGLFVSCGRLGGRCCRAPEWAQNIPAFGPLVACDTGLGCDITTNRCVSTCGQPGQPCCDGPETRAPKWTAKGDVYSPNSPFMQEMCSQGACDRQSHRCFTCGVQDDAPCCPPDAAQATARCRADNLYCEFHPWGFYESGTCKRCGKLGNLPCGSDICDPGLGIRLGLCANCGGDFELPCDGNKCDSGLGRIGGLCRNCGDVGEVPCDSGCKGGLRRKNGLCAVCGAHGQPPCDTGCLPGTVQQGGLCTNCGNNMQIPCANGWCAYPLKVAAGLCRYCGAQAQPPCDAGGCNAGLIVGAGGTCTTPSPPPEPNCAQAGEACAPDHLAGKHCCKNGQPLLCYWGAGGNTCKGCVPHGLPCSAGNQVCCTYGDICKFDPGAPFGVCDLPD